jgi:hypothetical protein
MKSSLLISLAVVNKVNCPIVVTLLALAGCERARGTTHVDTSLADSTRATTQQAAANPAPVDGPPTQVDVPLPNPTLTCTPTNFGPKDTLRLHMNTPHGDYLIATQPGDSLFYVIYPQLNVQSRKYSLMPPEELKQMETLRLPADVKAVPWYAGRDTTVAPLFPRSGKYVLTMGEKLEGSHARGASCTVTFSSR